MSQQRARIWGSFTSCSEYGATGSSAPEIDETFVLCSHAGMEMELLPGQRLARGVCRHLMALDMMPMTEFVPARGLRVDVIALGPKGEIWIIECKSSRADYMGDHKWQGYLDWCDRYFWAVHRDFPTDLLPLETGLIIADDFDAAIFREAPLTPLAGARRKALTARLARGAMGRLALAIDGDARRDLPFD